MDLCPEAGKREPREAAKTEADDENEYSTVSRSSCQQAVMFIGLMESEEWSFLDGRAACRLSNFMSWFLAVSYWCFMHIDGAFRELQRPSLFGGG